MGTNKILRFCIQRIHQHSYNSMQGYSAVILIRLNKRSKELNTEIIFHFQTFTTSGNKIQTLSIDNLPLFLFHQQCGKKYVFRNRKHRSRKILYSKEINMTEFNKLSLKFFESRFNIVGSEGHNGGSKCIFLWKNKCSVAANKAIIVVILLCGTVATSSSCLFGIAYSVSNALKDLSHQVSSMMKYLRIAFSFSCLRIGIVASAIGVGSKLAIAGITPTSSSTLSALNIVLFKKKEDWIYQKSVLDTLAVSI
jgi:hypothetical protein